MCCFSCFWWGNKDSKLLNYSNSNSKWNNMWIIRNCVPCLGQECSTYSSSTASRSWWAGMPCLHPWITSQQSTPHTMFTYTSPSPSSLRTAWLRSRTTKSIREQATRWWSSAGSQESTYFWHCYCASVSGVSSKSNWGSISAYWPAFAWACPLICLNCHSTSYSSFMAADLCRGTQ